MPLVHMLGRDRAEAEAVAVRIGATNLRDVSKDYREAGELWVGDTHVGVCIQEYEHNSRDDSDFGMIVWDVAKGAPQSIVFASTRGWSYPCMASHVDATPEILALYRAHREKMDREARERHAEVEVRLPRKGRTVRVIAGRKAPKGTEALVFWERIEKPGFKTVEGKWYLPTGRVGLQLANGERIFVGANQVEVVQNDLRKDAV